MERAERRVRWYVEGRVYGKIEAEKRAVEEIGVGRASFHAGGVAIYPGGFPGFTPMIKTLFALDWYKSYALTATRRSMPQTKALT